MTTKTVKTRATFDEEIEHLHLRGQWKFDDITASLTDGPPPGGVPYVWTWETVKGVLLEACGVMPDSLTQRRNVNFLNPGLRMPGTSNSIMMGAQLVTPGELAWGHRHTMGAIRFGIEGDERLYTVVDGDTLPMLPGDLVLTPAWTWHDHHNESDRNGIWLDVLDVPLIFALNQARFEPFGESLQPRHAAREDEANLRSAVVRPAWEARPATSTPLRYAWRDVRDMLATYRTRRASPYDDVLLEYVNPFTGGPTLPTLGCYVQRLRPGFAGDEHRHTWAAVYHAVEGSGVTVCGTTELRWSAGDSFVVPNWTKHRHVNASSTSDAVLFSATDRPVLVALGLDREDPEPATYVQPAPVAPGNRR